MPRSLIFAAALCLVCNAASAQVPESPVGYTGSLVSAGDDNVVLTMKDGKTVTVAMTKGWTVGTARSVKVDAVKRDDFIATINVDIDAGSGRANELRIFEPGYRPEIGTHAMPQPHTSITHGTVSTTTPTPDGGRELLITYPNGSRRVMVGPDVKVTAYDLQPRSLAKPGSMVNAITRKDADGVPRAGRLLMVTE